ncbi:hypothetical protein ACIQB5_42185 [Streptomyces sp. NPDC088560]|uniref:hypothetical protein n=1 Tax=Streptomyces sp. NPDC088560 TaxID=3365868 RepID=UPI003823D76F
MHGLKIFASITDPYGVPDPRAREGWQCVRGMAAHGETDTVITRWPAAIAPDSAEEARHTEIADLRAHGVTVQWTWAPLDRAGSGDRAGAGQAPGRHRSPNRDGRLAGALLLAADALGAVLVVTQAQQARAAPAAIEQPDHPPADELKLDRSPPHPDRYGTRPPLDAP